MTAVGAVKAGLPLLLMPRRFSFRIRSHGTNQCLLVRTKQTARERATI
ncbi:Uncharacterised protein [Comamonas terrigena]|nr:Uncharacterised protein [Comamonas terrigena]